MNRLHLVLLLLLSVFMTAVQAQQRVSDNQMKANMGNNTIRLTIKGSKTFTATLADNSSADALIELLSKGDVTVEMEDYGNMEKWDRWVPAFRAMTDRHRPVPATSSFTKGNTW